MKFSSDFLKKVGLSFVRAFAGSLLVFVIGLAQAPEWGFNKAAGLAALTAAVTAGLRAAQHVFET